MSAAPTPNRPLTLLTIAGSDSGGGAGIQADLKTFQAHGAYGLSVITSVTAQNTRGVDGVWDVPAEGVAAQLHAVLSDFPIDAIKIGMLSNAAIVRSVASILSEKRLDCPIVLDPVMVSSTGARLLQADAIDDLRRLLLPLSTLITPNRMEAELLGVTNGSDGAVAVLVTGGDEPIAEEGSDTMRCVDVLLWRGERTEMRGDYIRTRHTHGTGCTLSAAIAANLASGMEMAAAIDRAREYVRRAILAAPDIGSGHGPLGHWLEGRE